MLLTVATCPRIVIRTSKTGLPYRSPHFCAFNLSTAFREAGVLVLTQNILIYTWDRSIRRQLMKWKWPNSSVIWRRVLLSQSIIDCTVSHLRQPQHFFSHMALDLFQLLFLMTCKFSNDSISASALRAISLDCWILLHVSEK